MSFEEFKANGFSFQEYKEWKEKGGKIAEDGFFAKKWANASFSPSYANYLNSKLSFTPVKALNMITKLYSKKKINIGVKELNQVLSFEIEKIKLRVENNNVKFSYEEKDLLSSKLNIIYHTFKKNNLKRIGRTEYDLFINTINSLREKLNVAIIKNKGRKMGRDYFKGLLNIIALTNLELKKIIEDFLKKYENDDDVLIDDALELIKNIALYFKNTTDKYKNEDLDGVAEDVLNYYKNHHSKLKAENQKELLKHTNVILYAVGWTPVNKEGVDLSEAQIKTFYDEIYNSYA